MKKKIVGILFIGIVFGLVFSYGTYEGIERTSGANFCAMCHEMAPMRASFDQDVHGGKGKSGIRAKCVDCHLPHDSLANYIFTKAVNGITEVKMHITGEAENIDWKEHRKDRANFVYDDGCMKCHTNYETNEKFSKKALQMHKHYKSLKGTSKELGCASCHNEVGHNGLNNMLNIYYPKYPLYEEGSAKEKAKIEEKLYGSKE